MRRACLLELALLQCAARTGAAAQELGKKTARDLIRILRESELFRSNLTVDVLLRIEEVLRDRNELAHGAPMNLPNRPNVHGFVKGSRPDGRGFTWVGFAPGELEGLLANLRELSSLVQAAARRDAWP